MNIEEINSFAGIRVELCPACDVSAGIRSGAMGYRVAFTGGTGVKAAELDFAELAEGVDDERFYRGLREAVEKYISDSARLSYLGYAWSLLGRGRKYVVGCTYRAVVWAGDMGGSYRFGFKPLDKVTSVRGLGETMPSDAYIVNENLQK